MLKVEKLLPGGQRLARSLREQASRLVLPYSDRCRSRLRTTLVDGTEVGLMLPRGTVLRSGTMLVAEDGRLIRVDAAAEPILRVRSPDPLLMLRAGYHLGNRHTPVQIALDALCLERDPVLADMLRRLGLSVEEVNAPFEPEAGAYGGGHRHGHDETFEEDYALAQAAFAHHHAPGADSPGTVA